EAPPQLIPEALVGPLIDVLGERALHVAAAARGRAHAAQREAPLVVHVDQLLRHGRGLGEHAEPAERVDALVRADRRSRHALPRHAVEAVAAGNEIAFHLLVAAVRVEAHARMRVDAVQAHVVGLVHALRVRGGARVHQVLRDLGLAVDDDLLAAGEAGEIDAVARARKEDAEALVAQPLAPEAPPHARGLEHVNHALLEHPGADAPEHVFTAATLDDDGVDAREVQQLAEEQSRGTRADDGDLYAHGSMALRARLRSPSPHRARASPWRGPGAPSAG